MSSYIGAGVQPYYFDLTSHKTFLALGEDINKRFDGHFSDFGGGPQPIQEASIDCAARECKEELGIEARVNEITTMLSDVKLSYHVAVPKNGGRSYHLYLLNMREHKPTNCNCMVCSFKPNKEKRSIVWFEANEVYHAVHANKGTIIRVDRTYQLRPCYITCVKKLPGYSAYLQSLSKSHPIAAH